MYYLYVWGQFILNKMILVSIYLFIYLFSYGLLKHENMQLSLYKAYQKLRNDH
jgi:hypothetical protein